MARALPVRLATAAVLVPGVVLASGCAAPGPAGAAPSATPSGPQRHAVSATVLESPDHGPQLCAAVAESLPPRCSGPDVVGWDWAAVAGEESLQGTTWGDHRVVGTWDGERLTLTEPPGPPSAADGGGVPGRDPSTPCPAPDGGWRVLDPATATGSGRQAAVDHANARPDVGAVWLDTGAELAGDLPGTSELAVLVVSVAGDPGRLEAELRDRYGGPLCVVRAPRSRADLAALQERVLGALGGEVLASAPDGIRGRVTVLVPVADRAARDRVAAVDPDGLVELQSWLQPVG